MNCLHPKTMWPHRCVEYTDRFKEEPITVPCGHCIACLANKRNDWSIRLVQEHKSSSSAYFVTLTYDQKHYPSDGSLRKIDLQNYMKRLRKRDGTNRIRYYAVGEYGSKSGRAHYHLILFNVGEVEHIRSAWNDSRDNPIGIVHIGSVTAASVAYVLKYIVQPELIPKDSSKQKPFSLMSRGYGIGAHYLTDEMVRWHREGDRNYTFIEGEKNRLPRFYREKIWPTVKFNGTGDSVAMRYMVMRKNISDKALALSLDNQRKEREYFEREYGSRADQKMKEFRDAVISGIKTKISYTQSI